MSNNKEYIESFENDIGVVEFGFCGCGNISQAIKYVRDSMKLINELSEEVHTDILSYKDWKEKTNSHYSSEGAMYFMYYWLDEKEYTEHGSCVPGWLTAKGKKMLNDLNQYIKVYEQQTESTETTGPKAGQ